MLTLPMQRILKYPNLLCSLLAETPWVMCNHQISYWLRLSLTEDHVLISGARRFPRFENCQGSNVRCGRLHKRGAARLGATRNHPKGRGLHCRPEFAGRQRSQTVRPTNTRRRTANQLAIKQKSRRPSGEDSIRVYVSQDLDYC